MLFIIIFAIHSLFSYYLSKTVYLILKANFTKFGDDKVTNLGTKSFKTMIIMGSGGHTGEILKLLTHMPSNYSPRTYIIAGTDKLSGVKVHKFEEEHFNSTDFQMLHITRSREVRQAWMSTVVSSFVSLKESLLIFYTSRPDLLLCNGPGTCVPMCLIAFIFNILSFKYHTKIVFIESFCRVKTLSLSGRILYHLCDVFVVLWPKLARDHTKASYLGRII